MAVTLSERPADLLDRRLVAWRSKVEEMLGDRCKVEILGGEVILSPLAMTLHDRIVNDLHAAFIRSLDEEVYDLSQRVEFVVDAWNSPQPDLAIMDADLRARTLDATEYYAKDALLVVEVTSPSNAANDRKWGMKYKAYAKGLVPIYLLIDPHAEDEPTMTLFTEPNGKRYKFESTAPFGKTLRLPEPFDAVQIDSSRFPVPASS